MELEEEKKDNSEQEVDMQKETEELIKKYEKLNRPNYFELMMNGEFSKLDDNKSTSEQN